METGLFLQFCFVEKNSSDSHLALSYTSSFCDINKALWLSRSLCHLHTCLALHWLEVGHTSWFFCSDQIDSDGANTKLITNCSSISFIVQQLGVWNAKSFAICSAAKKPSGCNWACSSAAKQRALKCNIIWGATAGDCWLTYLTTDETDSCSSPLAVRVPLIWCATAHQLGERFANVNGKTLLLQLPVIVYSSRGSLISSLRPPWVALNDMKCFLPLCTGSFSFLSKEKVEIKRVFLVEGL